MIVDFTDINYLKDPCIQVVKADYTQFLLSLDELTVIDITGTDLNQTRVITTLINGDEPSGFIAIHRWLSQRTEKPATNIRIVICSVEAASLPPLFKKASIESAASLYSCLCQSPIQGADSKYVERAKVIAKKVNEVSPQVVLDIHNTPGSNPAFAFSGVITPEILTLTSFFCPTLILNSLKEGLQFEKNFNAPTLGIACGESEDEQSHEVAYQGIKALIQCEHLKAFHQEQAVSIIYKPMRLTLQEKSEINFDDHDEGENGVTLKPKLELLNYGGAQPGQMFGWLDSKGLNNLELLNDVNKNVIDEYFHLRENQLVVKKSIKVFMAHNNVKKAKSECICYIVDA